eukprot:COSAG01_NODE_13492_length_1578_cov_0.942529_1_plen_465_part_01
MNTAYMSKPMNVDALLEKFLPNSLELNATFNTLAGQVQNSIESHSEYIAAIKGLTWEHVYRKHVLTRNQNFVFGTKDLPRSRNGVTANQVESCPWPMLPDGSTVPKQDQHSLHLRRLYMKFNPDSTDFRRDCCANNYAWLHDSNIQAIVQAARLAIKGKLYKEFCAKKSLEKLCRVTFKPESFIVGLNEALFSAKPIFPPVEQGDEVMYCNGKFMVCQVDSAEDCVQLCPTEANQTIDSNMWIPRANIDTKLHKKPRAMTDQESDVMAEALQHAYDRAVKSLESADVTTFVSKGCPAEAIMFYLYLGCMYEMQTYIEPRGVILRNDWQTVLFDSPSVDHAKDNYVTFTEDGCVLTLNSNTKTNKDGSAPTKKFEIGGTRFAQFLKLWQPFAHQMQNQTFRTSSKEFKVEASKVHIVCHYSGMHPSTFGLPYTKKGAFYNSVKASLLKYYPALKSFKECLGSTSSR